MTSAQGYEAIVEGAELATLPSPRSRVQSNETVTEMVEPAPSPLSPSPYPLLLRYGGKEVALMLAAALAVAISIGAITRLLNAVTCLLQVVMKKEDISLGQALPESLPESIAPPSPETSGACSPQPASENNKN